MNRPVDPSSRVTALHPGDRPFSSDPGQAYTLPSRFYHDPEVFELEKEGIFYRNWVYVGHASRLARPGDYLTARIHDQSVFVIRERAGGLRAFYNVCPHRGHELLSGEGSTNLIVCPYHAWSFSRDGRLQSARNCDRVAGFDKCEFSLKPVRLELLCGLVFVNLDPDAVPLSEQAGDLESEIRHYCPEVDDLMFAQRDHYEVVCNWKVAMDNFLECYHCAPAHRDFVDLVEMSTYRTVTHGIHASLIAGSPKSFKNNAYCFEKGAVDFGYAGWYLWPNLTIWIYPGEPNLSVLQMNPAAPGTTTEYQDWFLPSAEPSRQLQDAMAYQKDVLQPEDISLCESVQRGLKSRGYNQGRIMVDREHSELSEHAVHHFQSLVAGAIGAQLGGPKSR